MGSAVLGEAITAIRAWSTTEVKGATPGSADICFRIAAPIEAAVEHLDMHGVEIVDGPSPRNDNQGRPARSVYFRYCQEVATQPESALLHSSQVSQSALTEPEGFYPGEYLKETGRRLFERDGERWIGKAETVWLRPLREFAVAEMMALIRDDLAAIGIAFDRFSSELALTQAGAIEKALAVLEGSLRPGDCVLVKGARVLELERIAEALTAVNV